MPEVLCRGFEPSDYPAARALWRRTEGLSISQADEPDAIGAFLLRNPGLSFVATVDGAVVGTILCGHDGRRGFIYHLAVAAPQRRRGIARTLLRSAMQAFRRVGIDKCHLLVFAANADGLTFWRNIGAQERVELAVFSVTTPAAAEIG